MQHELKMFSIRIGLILSFASNLYFLANFAKLYFHSSIGKDSTVPKPTENTIQHFPCNDQTPRYYHSPRGDYFILHNYFMAEKSFRCDQSITLATQGEWTDLGKLSSLVKRWRGPVSFVLYAPGNDFTDAVAHIQYLRECRRNKNSSKLLKDLVTFHVIFDLNHFAPERIPQNPSAGVNCSSLKGVTFKYSGSVTTYKMAFGLEVPMNLARNIAREGATTKFVLALDVGMYPSGSGKLIPDFLEMIKRDKNLGNRKVFVLPEFEVDEDAKLPKDKRELVKMTSSKKAHVLPIPFPKSEEWLKAPIGGNMTTLHVSKLGEASKVKDWKPIFIGTSLEPLHDERLSWDEVGQSEKVPQFYALCLLDYDLHILDNAFVVRRPKDTSMSKINQSTLEVVTKQEEVMGELEWLYGLKEECKSMRPT